MIDAAESQSATSPGAATASPPASTISRGSSNASLASAPVSRTRSVSLERGAAPTPVPVLEKAALRPGHRFNGPALVDAVDTTIWVPAGVTARVDRALSVRMEAAS